MNILMVIGQFRPIIGGAEAQAERLARALVDVGQTVEILTGSPRKPKTPALEVINSNLKIRRLWAPGFGKIKMFLLQIAFFCAIYRRRKSSDVLHVHQANWPAFPTVLAARCFRKPVVVKVGNSGSRFDLDVLEKSFPICGRLMASYVAKHATVFVAINRQIDRDLHKWKVEKSRIVLIPNGVPPQKQVSPPVRKLYRTQLGLPLKRNIIICIGTLLAKKNQKVFIKAMRELVEKGGDVIALLLGDGPQRSMLERLVVEYQLMNNVIFKGSVSNVSDYLSAADIFVLPSLTEGLSNALLEAMAFGMPCIVSDVPGNRDLVKNGMSGLLFPVSDAHKLMVCIEKLLTNKSLSINIGIVASRLIEERYSLPKIAQKYSRLYISVTSLGCRFVKKY